MTSAQQSKKVANVMFTHSSEHIWVPKESKNQEAAKNSYHSYTLTKQQKSSLNTMQLNQFKV